MTKEAWEHYANATKIEVPRLTPREFADLSPSDRTDVLRSWHRAHGSLGPYDLKALAETRDEILALCDANDDLEEGRVRRGAAIDGLPNLGKTTMLRVLGRRYHLNKRAEYGTETEDGDEYWPVVYVTLPRDASIKGVNGKLRNFFNLVPKSRESPDSLTDRVIDALQRNGTSLVLIDDLHFVRPRELYGKALNDHLKHLMNEVAATFVFAGVGLDQAGIFSEGESGDKRRYAQLKDRLRRYEVAPLDIQNAEQKDQWRRLLAAIERDLRLLKPLRLRSDELSDYLFRRTQGSIGSLVDLMQLGAKESLKRDADRPLEAEGITISLLDDIKLSKGADDLRSDRPRARRHRGRTRERDAA